MIGMPRLGVAIPLVCQPTPVYELPATERENLSFIEEIVMKFLSIYKTAERGVPPTQEEIAKMGKLIEDHMKAGTLIATEGCMPSALGARVRLSKGKLSVTDGPFTEAKEVVGG